MLQVRASPSIASPSSSQAPTLSASFGRNLQRQGGGVRVASGGARQSVMAAAGAIPAAKLEDADELIDSVETFIFDCDGDAPAQH
jgi:phosphoglycolate phosphatase